MMIFRFILLIFLFTGNLYAGDLLNNVVIVSIDALHPDAVTGKNAPNIMKAMEKGVIRLDGRSTKPPKTLISHSAMFSGLTPQTGGKADNLWQKGEPAIPQKTIFTFAKEKGYRTGLVYSKAKLGYLVNGAVDTAAFSKEYPIDKTIEYVNMHDKNFIFLHISGLDHTGPEYGWLSKEYIEDFNFIDEELKPLIEAVQKKSKYLLIITSDHAGHARIHGSDHPDDCKLPFMAVSDTVDVRSDALNSYETYMLGAYLHSVGIY